MVDKELKELMEELRVTMEDLKDTIDNLRFTIKELHAGDRGLMSLVDKIGYLDKSIENLTKAIRK